VISYFLAACALQLTMCVIVFIITAIQYKYSIKNKQLTEIS